MTLKDRLILIADLAYRFRQVDGSDGAIYDAGEMLRLGQSLDDVIKSLHDKLGKPYSKDSGRRPLGRRFVKFSLQSTRSFPEGAPQRESYDHDADLFKAEEKYAAEWRMEYECPGCQDIACPQCGKRST